MNPFYDAFGEPNPFAIDEPTTSIEAANKILNILTGPASLADSLGVTGQIIDTGKDYNGVVEVPARSRYQIQLTGAKPEFAAELARIFNESNPELLRITLNDQYNIGTLGPKPLPLPFGYNFAYQSAYMSDPLALDPGPVPGNILGYIAGLEKKKKAAAAAAKGKK